jgi:exodeoxyribonuclease VII small subunit
MTRKNSKFNFEESLAHLESLVEALEEGELSLEESLKAFEEGIKLTRECQQALEAAEQKVRVLVSDGQIPQSEPFGTEADEGEDSAPE